MLELIAHEEGNFYPSLRTLRSPKIRPLNGRRPLSLVVPSTLSTNSTLSMPNILFLATSKCSLQSYHYHIYLSTSVLSYSAPQDVAKRRSAAPHGTYRIVCLLPLDSPLFLDCSDL